MDDVGPWIFILGIILVAWLYMYFKQTKYPLSLTTSNVDGQQYLVRNLPDKQDAADRLARVRERLLRLRKYLEQTHKSKPFVANMLKNFDCGPQRFSESTPDAQYTSYSVNKGEKIHMCLRQRDASERLVDENIVTFVAVHEMAHTGTESIGHTPEFWNNFAWLIKQAEHIKIYEFMDFAAHPVEYCGVHITDSPTYKSGVKDGIKGKGEEPAL
jgi:predicted metal-dependent hydrolase